MYNDTIKSSLVKCEKGGPMWTKQDQYNYDCGVRHGLTLAIVKKLPREEQRKVLRALEEAEVSFKELLDVENPQFSEKCETIERARFFLAPFYTVENKDDFENMLTYFL